MTGLRIEDESTVYREFANVASKFPERPFQWVVEETAAAYGIAAGPITYGDTLGRIEFLRARYVQAGYGVGCRVILALENRPEYFMHWYALNGLGASVVPVNPDLRHAELVYMIGHAEPRLAVAIGPRGEELTAAAEEAGVAMPVIEIDDVPPNAGPLSVGSDTTPLRREAAMLYTSGTTGKPKGCVLSNLYFLYAGEWYRNVGGLCELKDGERMITPLPLFHMNAMAVSSMAMVAVGGCLTVLDRFHPSTWWNSVRESGATCLHYLGVMPSMLMSASESAKDKEHQIRFGFGAGIVKELHEPFETRFGFPLVEAWAMTETGVGATVAANQPPRKIGMSVLGKPSAEVEVRIVAESGQEAGPDEPGELLVRHAGADPRYGFFTEYYRDEAATAEVWAGGWFHTGDVVSRDVDGDMVFVDRKKNVIRRSGENIAALEVESVLLGHPDVASVAVTAVPDAVRGDEVLALIVPVQVPVDEAARLSLAIGIVSWCLTQMAYYKPPGFVAFVEALPLTSTQKIQRGEVIALAAKLHLDEATVNTCSLKRRTKK
jgi:acyl-CoA synthetase (AMP-forming)/AMP-acid ligase II